MLSFNKFCENIELNVDVLVLQSIPKFITETELWEKYEQICKRNNVMALTIQLKAALKRLKVAGLIVFQRGLGVKKI